MSKNKNFFKKSLVIAISSILFSQVALAQNENNNTSDIKNEESVSDIINPFKSSNQNLEDVMLQKKMAEEKLDLIDSEIELDKRKFEKEMLPYQQAIQRQQLNAQLYQTQQESSPEPEAPRITDNDIQKKIEDVAGSIINEQKETINKLKTQIVEKNTAKNTFNLKLIANNTNETFAIINNSEGDHRITKGEKVEGWSVIGIDPDNQKVILRKGRKTEVVTPNIQNKVSQIMKNNSSSMTMEDDSNTGMPNPDLPVPPNFSN